MTSVRTGHMDGSANAVELQLLRQTADGDRGAFDKLFRTYHPRLFSFLFRLTKSHGAAEELTNDVLLTLWKDAGRFRRESKVSTWIFGIAYRQSLTYLRKRRLKLVPLGDHHVMTDEIGGQLEREDWVRQGIELLPPKQKLTVTLVYYLGLSCEETAQATGVPMSTVKTRMFHARRKMKLYLEESGSPQAEKEDSCND